MVTMHRHANWKIAVYGADHGIAHFHVEGPGFRCSVAITTRELIVGDAPARVLARMSATNTMRTIESVKATGPARLRLRWSDGAEAELDLTAWLAKPAFAALRDPAEFARVQVGDWGHSLAWPSGPEAGADSLWLETLTATRREGARAFLDWRLRHALSLTAAAEALGLSRRMVAYYSNGEKPVPKTVRLACRGWEAGHKRARSKTAA
jgi:hypothetical protein